MCLHAPGEPCSGSQKEHPSQAHSVLTSILQPPETQETLLPTFINFVCCRPPPPTLWHRPLGLHARKNRSAAFSKTSFHITLMTMRDCHLKHSAFECGSTFFLSPPLSLSLAALTADLCRIIRRRDPCCTPPQRCLPARPLALCRTSELQ